MAQTNARSAITKGRILVVGAGYSGLATAIELIRVGYEVEVIEAVKALSTQGIAPPAAATLF
jgi:2-polyprenyl-6-methoxyphenol hydroxylase-like FAD-dependent oxidoreductase